jgi:hypothetical protein
LINSDHVAQAYRILETSGRARPLDIGETPESDHLFRVMWAYTTLEGLRDRAAKSTWARRAAGSSGIFGLPTGFLEALQHRNIAPFPTNLGDLYLENPPSDMFELGLARSAIVYAGLGGLLEEEPHAYLLLAHKHRVPAYPLDPYTQDTLREWHLLDDAGGVNQAIGQIMEDEVLNIPSTNRPIIVEENELNRIVSLRYLLHDYPEAFYALVERYRDPNYHLGPRHEGILRARGLPLDPQDANYEAMRGLALDPISFDVFDTLSLRHQGRFIVDGIRDLSQAIGPPVTEGETSSMICSNELSQAQAGRAVLARKLEEIVRRDGRTFVELVYYSRDPSGDAAILKGYGLSPEKTRIFFRSPSPERDELYRLHEELHGESVEAAVREISSFEIRVRTTLREGNHPLLLASRELNNAFQLFQHNPSQGPRFAEAVKEFISVSIGHRPSAEELALHLAGNSERSILDVMSALMELGGRRPGDFVEAIGRAREAGLFGEGEAANKAEREKDRRPGRPRRPKK